MKLRRTKSAPVFWVPPYRVTLAHMISLPLQFCGTVYPAGIHCDARGCLVYTYFTHIASSWLNAH